MDHAPVYTSPAGDRAAVGAPAPVLRVYDCTRPRGMREENVAKRIRIIIGGITAEASLHEDRAPITVAALWNELPFADRTVHVAWSGSAWRTEQNHELRPANAPVENVTKHLTSGDIIFYPGHAAKLIKVGFCYGNAQWLAPFGIQVDVALIGKIDRNLAEFERICQRILADGPMTVWLSKLEERSTG